MKIQNKIKYLDEEINRYRKKHPDLGLPEDLFLFATRITPIINVDLLIKDESGRTLLSWRDDEFAGQGWHIPGGVVRYKETLEERVIKVSRSEIGIDVEFNKKPISYNEVILDQCTRGHFFSVLYECSAPSAFVPNNKDLLKEDVGYLAWHKECPQNLVGVHEMYREHIRGKV